MLEWNDGYQKAGWKTHKSGGVSFNPDFKCYRAI